MSSRTASRQGSALTAATILLLLLAAPGSPLAAQGGASGSTPEDSVRAVELSRAQALLKADTAALSRMVADEFVEISRLGQLRTKTDNIRDIGSGTSACSRCRIRYLRIFVRRDGRWQAVAMQQTIVP